jgi:hypothetical protein
MFHKTQLHFPSHGKIPVALIETLSSLESTSFVTRCNLEVAPNITQFSLIAGLGAFHLRTSAKMTSSSESDDDDARIGREKCRALSIKQEMNMIELTYLSRQWQPWEEPPLYSLWMASSEVDQKFLGHFAKTTTADNNYLSR